MCAGSKFTVLVLSLQIAFAYSLPHPLPSLPAVFRRHGLAQEAGLPARGSAGHRAEEQQLQDRQVGALLLPGRLQLHQVWVSNFTCD